MRILSKPFRHQKQVFYLILMSIFIYLLSIYYIVGEMTKISYIMSNLITYGNARKSGKIECNNGIRRNTLKRTVEPKVLEQVADLTILRPEKREFGFSRYFRRTRKNEWTTKQWNVTSPLGNGEVVWDLTLGLISDEPAWWDV